MFDLIALVASVLAAGLGITASVVDRRHHHWLALWLNLVSLPFYGVLMAWSIDHPVWLTVLFIVGGSLAVLDAWLIYRRLSACAPLSEVERNPS
jgi:hypothetical protein